MSQKTLEKVTLGVGAIMENVYIYIPDPKDPANMKYKKDVTEEFEKIATYLGYEKKEQK